ncbi:hypothetical protein [Methyloglobulus sp.]|uniref:hypothetical protein n=1 Tax=Methyloglobulus sp. TaxID=2518622 RepID=UPI0032B7B20E
MTNIKLTDANLKNLQIVLEYLSDSEKKSYEEYIFNNFEEVTNENSDLTFDKEFYNKSEIEHIYAYTQRVKDAIETNINSTFD